MPGTPALKLVNRTGRPEKPVGFDADPMLNSPSPTCGIMPEKNSPSCRAASKSSAANPSAAGATVQTSDTLSPFRVPSYLSHDHLPTLSVPIFLNCVGGPDVPAIAAPRPFISAS